MEYLGKITDPKDLTTKEYVDNGVSGVQTSLTTHINDKENPHNVTKGQVGLSNVDNIKQWSTNNHPTTLSGYGITDAATSSQLSALTTRVNTNEDNIAMAETDIESLQGDVGTLKTDMTTVKGAVTTLQDTYVPNTRKINGKALSADVTLTASDVGALPSTTQIPTKTSDLDNDSGFITSAPVTSVNSKTGAVTLGASDVGALPITGGTLTGDLKVGSASLGTNGYVVGTWLQGTAVNHMTTAATKICVQDSSGWVYHRTASEVKSDIGAGNTDTYKISNLTVATSSWVANTNSQAADQEKTDYPFMATISITTPAVTTNDIARVMFGYTEQASGNYSLNCYTTTNGVIIQATEKPSAAITLEYILIERIL